MSMHTIQLSNGAMRLRLSTGGQMVALESSSVRLLSLSADPVLCEVSRADTRAATSVSSAHLRQHSDSEAEFEVDIDIGVLATLSIRVALSDPDDNGTAVICRLFLRAQRPPEADVRIRWFWNFRLASAETRLFAPLYHGLGLHTSRARRQSWNYVCAGRGSGGSRLALPLIDESPLAGGTHLTYFADPLFSTGITLARDDAPDQFECEFLAAAGAEQFQERTFGLYLHQSDAHGALQGFFRHMLPGSPAGPAWLHEIAIAHYDFLSEKGQGWFHDIDRLGELFTREERSQIALTLHGWYDFLGRYCYDTSTGTLDRQWTVMPRGDKHEMTLEEMHRRIAYAKERGFRLLLYYADGMAIDSGAPHFRKEIVFLEPDGTPRQHHWGGPDTVAQTYVMDPVHPRVKEFFRCYTRALLQEFGREIDGLTWDETFTTRVGDLSRGPHPGYADREFMLLASELREMIKQEDSSLAFLASDAAGLALPQEAGTSYWRAFPAQNALLFDGTYQDSQCYPTAWQYGLFPNYRNVLWSCNWRPVENFEWTVLGVKAFGAPLAISNGWGENRGISRYTEAEVKALMDLYRFRRDHRSRVRWIDSTDL